MLGRPPDPTLNRFQEKRAVVDEKTRGPAVDDNVVGQRSKEPQSSTVFNRPFKQLISAQPLENGPLVLLLDRQFGVLYVSAVRLLI
jgi:hypothetical protein